MSFFAPLRPIHIMWLRIPMPHLRLRTYSLLKKTFLFGGARTLKALLFRLMVVGGVGFHVGLLRMLGSFLNPPLVWRTHCFIIVCDRIMLTVVVRKTGSTGEGFTVFRVCTGDGTMTIIARTTHANLYISLTTIHVVVALRHLRGHVTICIARFTYELIAIFAEVIRRFHHHKNQR